MDSRSTTAPDPALGGTRSVTVTGHRSWGRLVVCGGVAALTVLLLAGCPSSDDAEPACEQPSPGTASTTCDDNNLGN
jgi:hypothetical protein